MKKIYYLSLVVLFPLISFSQEVEEKQTPLVVKKTTTGCMACGVWGWDLYDEVKDERDDVSVLIEMHSVSSSILYSQASASLYNFHEPRSSTPVFYVNTVNEVEYLAAGTPNALVTKTNMLSAIDNTVAESPEVNTGISYSIDNNKLNIDTKVKFFQDATGEYYLNVYLAEENVEASQMGIGMATHKRILRSAAYPNSEGELILDGSASAGDEFLESHEVTIDPNWSTSDFYVFAVIWKKENGSFNYENASKQRGALNTDNLTLNDINMSIYPNAIESGQAFNIHVDKVLDNDTEVAIYDQVGKKVKSINVKPSNNSEQIIKIEETSSMNTGLYFVQLTSNSGAINRSMKLVVK